MNKAFACIPQTVSAGNKLLRYENNNIITVSVDLTDILSAKDHYITEVIILVNKEKTKWQTI